MADTLFGLACGITKAVIHCPWRTAVRRSLSTAGNGSGDSGILDPGALFRYHAQKLKMQFAGYLLVNNNLCELEEARAMGPALTPMSDEDWRWLTEGNRFISLVNSNVLRELSGRLSQRLLDVCDPYHGLRSGNQHPLPAPESFSDFDEHIAVLAKGFHSHPAVGFLEAAQTRLPVISDEQLSDLALLVKSIVEEEPGRPTAEDVEDLRGESRRTGQAGNILVATGAHLYSLRKALSIIDGLVYDAFLQDHLVVGSSENCFSFEEGHDRIGRRARIELQPTSKGGELDREPGGLIFLDLPRGARGKLTGPALIESTKTEMSQETGMTMSLDLRPLDEWLNPYPGLCSKAALGLIGSPNEGH